MDIHPAVAEMQMLRENKRQVQATQAVFQALRLGGAVSEADVEKLIEVLMRTIREPLEEKIALQQEQIASLRQQVEHLTSRATKKDLWS